MPSPTDFNVGEAWIVFKLNDAPVRTEEAGKFNVIAIMDAASCYILGAEIVSASLSEPSQLDAKRLIKTGFAHKNLFPGKVIIPDNLPAEFLVAEIEKQGIAVERIPEEQLDGFIAEARQGFQEHVGGGSTQ